MDDLEKRRGIPTRQLRGIGTGFKKKVRRDGYFS